MEIVIAKQHGEVREETRVWLSFICASCNNRMPNEQCHPTVTGYWVCDECSVGYHPCYDCGLLMKSERTFCEDCR